MDISDNEQVTGPFKTTGLMDENLETPPTQVQEILDNKEQMDKQAAILTSLQIQPPSVFFPGKRRYVDDIVVQPANSADSANVHAGSDTETDNNDSRGKTAVPEEANVTTQTSKRFKQIGHHTTAMPIKKKKQSSWPKPKQSSWPKQ